MHRLDEAVMRKYDEIIVLKHGEVAEQGTFDQLMKEKSVKQTYPVAMLWLWKLFAFLLPIKRFHFHL